MTASHPGADRIATTDLFTGDGPPLIATVVGSVAYAALLITTYVSTGNRGAVTLLLVVAAANVAAMFWRSAEARCASAVFEVAMLGRATAALIFEHASLTRDPFLGSPDAWNYHTWAVRLATAFHDGSFPSITSYYETGRFDVGYFYVLGFFYYLFGDAVLIGRLAGALFGALAVLMLFLLARRVAPLRAAFRVALIYALWPASIGWSAETILRDSFVWFLLLAGTWLAARVLAERRAGDLVALFGVMILLRYTRPYAAFFLYAGLGIAFVLAMVERARRGQVMKRSLPIAGVLLATEIFFAVAGFPNAVQAIRVYDVGHWIEHPMPAKSVELPPAAPVVAQPAPQTAVTPPIATTAPASTTTPAELPPAPRAIDTAALDAASPQQHASLPHPMPAKNVELPPAAPVVAQPAPQTAVTRPIASTAPASTTTPAELPPAPRAIDTAALDAASPQQHASLPGNAVRLLFGPFGWTFYLPGHSTWTVYSVWLWYFLLPAAVVGAFVLFRRGSLLTRALVLVTGLYMTALLVMGRGDSYRQRETTVPFLILIAIAGVLMLPHRRRILVPLYCAWLIVIGLAMTIHIYTLRGRQFSARIPVREAGRYVAHQSPPSHYDA